LGSKRMIVRAIHQFCERLDGRGRTPGRTLQLPKHKESSAGCPMHIDDIETLWSNFYLCGDAFEVRSSIPAYGYDKDD
jgi:hypothetical protein